MKKFFIACAAVLVACTLFGFTACSPKNFEQSALDKNVKIIYAEAVNLGYDGTLEEFLATIKGASGVGVSNVYIDVNGRLFVLLTDDTLLEVGEVKGKDGADGVGIVDIVKNSNDEIIVTLSNGVKKNIGKVASGKDGLDGTNGTDGVDGKNGINGKDGIGISSIIRNEDNEIIVTLTDGTLKSLGKVLDGKDGKDGTNGVDGKDGINGADGINGKDGIGISDIIRNENDEIIVILSDGTTKNLGKVADGKDGVDGKDGKDGINGADGTNGKDGVGISDIIRDENDEIIVILSDGTTKNLGKVADGKDGANGSDGANGKDGNDGLSAYELYLKYHPEYSGTEREWVEEMFGGVKEFTVTVKYGDKQTTVTVKRGDAVDLSGIDVTRDGYSFVKWTTDMGEDFDTSTPISADTTIVPNTGK